MPVRPAEEAVQVIRAASALGLCRLQLRIGAEITVVADAASVGSDAGSIRHDATVIAAPILMFH